MKQIVILDNGHGKEKAGKRSPVWSNGKQLLEWEFNRDIVKRIAHLLKYNDIAYKILVPEDTDISLGERCRRANLIYSQNDKKAFLVSVHANAGGGTGWECHIYTEKSKSKDYAIIFTDEARNFFAPEWRIRQPFPQSPYWISNFGILRETNCPAVLTENFFMDTERDCRFIMSENGRRDVAEMHVAAIKRIIKL